MKKSQIIDTPKMILMRSFLAIVVAVLLFSAGVCGIIYALVLITIDLFKRVFNHDKEL